MDRKKNTVLLIITILFPILSLFTLTLYKAYRVNSGQELILPIQGYNPRHILSGHYLIYQVDYGLQEKCPTDNKNKVQLCLNMNNEIPQSTILYNYNNGIHNDSIHDNYKNNEKCQFILQGSCKNGRFIMGIERFYIPEKKASSLYQIIRKSKGEIILKVDSTGKATIKNLLINHRPWQEYLLR